MMGSNFTQKSPTTEEEALSMAMCLATSHVPSMAFKAVLELNIIDIINDVGPEAQLSPAEIAAQLATANPDAAVVLDRLLRLLANFTILTFSYRDGPSGQPERVYGLGPVCQFLAKNGGGSSYTAFANFMYDKVMMDSWWVEHVGGDMYVSVPKGDAIFMKWTFFTGNDEKCIKLLKNCHEALPEDGKVIICEHVVSDELDQTTYQAHTGFIFDAIMLTFPGGRTRTKHEYEALGKQAGFETFRFVCFACDTWVMEFLKMPV
ncbi:caffeic acid 3-O-methyltransferase-like [Spinacia oleracea]|uniref:Caffeic acid 3-O-methyltransferase-like n=1 Tax=Spinacia oleracea TaxID=3562 RepID=A0ABM3RNM8_SPIOL|nr:caffeic acid 3-O-methyltransferase-like [Spinacia oleracea]